MLFLSGLLWLRKLARPSQVERLLGVGDINLGPAGA